ncbi:MAG: hypothetical protein J6B12_03615 [Clostridia bacterium]|nr:hypothetical protein [Clostridia bacterium]
MSFVLLAFKRLCRSLPFLLSLLCLTLCVTASLYANRAIEPSTAGYVALGEGEETEAMLMRLSGKGFVRYQTQETLREAIARGEIDCGVLFPADLEERITSANLEKSILFLRSPTAPLPVLFRLEIVTELLTSASPYFSTQILEKIAPGADLEDEIVNRYRYETQNGTGFVFDVETVSGEPPKETGFAVSLAVTVLSIFLFLMPLLQGCRLFQQSYTELEGRLGKKTALRTVFLPEALTSLVMTCLLLCLLLPLGAKISGQTDFAAWLVPALTAAVLSASLGLVLPLLLRRADSLQMLTVPVLLLTLVLCPLFINLALLFPQVSVFRSLLPTYWIFAAKDAPLLLGTIAILSLPIACFVLYLSKCRTKD